MPATRTKSTLPVLFSVIVIDLIGFGIMIPILPFYAEELGASATVLGGLLAAHAAMQFVFAPLWGRLSDRIGRKPVMMLTIAGTSGSLIYLGVADSIPELFVARLLSGVFAANISVATAYIADVTAEDERTRWMGMVGASFAVGFTLGPGLGGVLAIWGRSLPMFVAGGMAAVNLVFALAALQEPAQHAGRSEEGGGLREALRNRVLARLCTVNFLFTFAVTQLESTFAFFMMDRFDYDELQVAGILIGMAILMGGIQGGGMKRLAERAGERQLILVGFAMMAIAFPLVPLVYTVAILLIPLALSAVGRAIAQPSLGSITSLQAAAEHRGSVMGAFQSSAALARIFGPAAAGLLYDQGQGNPYYLASALLVAALGLSVLIASPAPNKRATPSVPPLSP